MHPDALKPKRVLFVCIGNSCRSQMAEGFARTYGKDVMEAHSAGLGPAPTVSPLSAAVMREKNISLDAQFPKGFDAFPGAPFDVIVNMSGQNLPAGLAPTVLEWTVHDPVGQPIEVHRAVAAEIEHRVMRLILALRKGRAPQ